MLDIDANAMLCELMYMYADNLRAANGKNKDIHNSALILIDVPENIYLDLL